MQIAKIAFTGSAAGGKAVMAAAAKSNLKHVSLELGGKSPTIVFDDADVDLAIAGVLFGIFSSSGQSCIAGSRLYVQRGIYDGFVARLVAAGGTEVEERRDDWGGHWMLMTDPEGNEFCVQ